MRYGIDWIGVEAKSVYRRYIADNAGGMDADELVRFFSIWGESGKSVGTRFENRGIGAKLTLVPWNKNGAIFTSWQPESGAAPR